MLYHGGQDPGQGQNMKLVNNALCISAYVTTSEALVYGERGGLDMDTMLQVLNDSSGQNFSTSEIFPKYVATGRYDESGADAHIVEKDLGLFVEGTRAMHSANAVITSAYEVIKAFAQDNPTQDQMRIYPFVRDNRDLSVSD